MNDWQDTPDTSSEAKDVTPPDQASKAPGLSDAGILAMQGAEPPAEPAPNKLNISPEPYDPASGEPEPAGFYPGRPLHPEAVETPTTPEPPPGHNPKIAIDDGGDALRAETGPGTPEKEIYRSPGRGIEGGG